MVHSSVEPVGSFFCSNELINQIHSNYRWTQVGQPPGIPHGLLPERRAYGLDRRRADVGGGRYFNFDMASFYSKFERDIRLGQYDTGSISGVSPPWDCNPVDPPMPRRAWSSPGRSATIMRRAGH